MEKGLTTKEVLQNQKKYGENTTSIQTSFSPIKLFLQQFPNTINVFLSIAAIFSFIINRTLDGSFILAIILLNGIFTFIQEYRAQKALEKLKEYTTNTTRVIRNGKIQEIPVEQVTVGDSIVLESGDKISSDGILSSGFHMEVDESVLTGESLPVIKNIGAQLFKGSFITKGKGYMKVEAIGAETKFGQISQTLQTMETTKTPLQKQITKLSKVLSLAGILIALLLLPIGIAEGRQLYPLLLLTISIAIASIPESLPGVITVALAVGTNRLAEKQAIVRKMISVETLGSAQILLTDKTGTITQNNMAVKAFFLLKEEYLPHMLEACLIGNTATISDNGSIIGDKTDGALLLWAKENAQSTISSKNIIDEYAFDSASKMITTVVLQNHQILAYMRGAPEELLIRSTLTKKQKDTVQKEITRFAQKGLRVIAFGYKKEQHKEETRSHIESHLIFLGIVGLYDPPRPTAKEAIKKAKDAGVRIVMVTGDNSLTAFSIAKEVGIAKDKDLVLTGEMLRAMDDTEYKESIKKVNVFARVLPEDKLQIVTKLKQEGFVVAVTGDGVNDALALEKADVGIAMGEKGSDVAKEAADIVLSSDDISVLVNAIREGRRIYDSLTRAIMYLLAGNLTELFFVIIATTLNHPLPLLPTQVLWINLITDALPALALASNTSDGRIGSNPRKPNAFILSKQSILFIIVSSVLLSGITFFSFSYFLKHESLGFSRMVAFNMVIGAEIFLALILNKFAKNIFLFVVAGLVLLAQIAITTLPIFQKIFQLH